MKFFKFPAPSPNTATNRSCTFCRDHLNKYSIYKQYVVYSLTVGEFVHKVPIQPSFLVRG